MNNMTKQIITRSLNAAIFVAVVVALSQTAGAIPPGNTPDAASTSCLTALACGALVAIRRLVR